MSLVNDWIRHAENKLGVTLAASGVMAGVLFNLVKERQHVGWALGTAATTCAAATIVAGVCAAIGLFPVVRLRHRHAQQVNLIYFSDIARAYRRNQSSYARLLESLTNDREQLVRNLAQQIHANAVVARRKYSWANRAIGALLAGLLALCAVTMIVALE